VFISLILLSFILLAIIFPSLTLLIMQYSTVRTLQPFDYSGSTPLEPVVNANSTSISLHVDLPSSQNATACRIGRSERDGAGNRSARRGRRRIIKTLFSSIWPATFALALMKGSHTARTNFAILELNIPNGYVANEIFTRPEQMTDQSISSITTPCYFSHHAFFITYK